MFHSLFRASVLMRLACCLSLSSLIFACQPSGPSVNQQPVPSAFPSVAGTPPPIPAFPAQVLPTAIPGSGGSKGGEMAAPMAPGSAADSAAGSGVVSGEASISRPAPMKPGAPPMDGMPIEPMPPINAGPQPEAGLLTAGEWDDLANWPFWISLLEKQEWSGMSTLWGLDTRQRISVQVKDAAGKPLADMPLKLQVAGSQTPLFQARTDTRGRAELFAGLEKPLTTQDLQVVLEAGTESLEQDVKLGSSDQSPLQFTVKQSLAPAVSADLMLVMDTTGSMGDELEYLKKELQNVASRISAQNRQDLTLRLSANFYRDLSDEYIVRPFPFTTDASLITKQLSEQSAGGGGDFPEAVDVALADAIDEHQWSPTARARLLFLVLDAPPHQQQTELERLRLSLSRAAAKGVRIIPVASSGIDKETEFLLRMMAISTGGRYVFLTDDSGIGGGHIEPTVGKYSVEKLNDLMVRIANEYITGDF